MRTLLQALTLAVVCGLSLGIACQTSYDCGFFQCCRDGATGEILSSQNQDMTVRGHGFGPGTCTPYRALPGEMCDGHCLCVPGVVCHPSKHDAKTLYTCTDVEVAEAEMGGKLTLN